MGLLAPVVRTNGGSNAIRYRGPVWSPSTPTAPIRIVSEPNIPSTSTSAATSGTPVPPGYSQNQIFVATDGSFWQYSSAQNKWLNVGTPYNTGAAAAAAASSAPATSTSTAATTTAPAPVNVTVDPSSASSSYSDVLTWLEGSTLITGLPNWTIALGAAALLFKISSGGGKK